jgi:hypothetical protein
LNKVDKCILQIVLDIKIISYIINRNFEIPQKNQDKRDLMYNRETKSVAFVQYSECLSYPLSFYATQMIYPFLNSSISANHDEGEGF